ncbi:GNAT family N-acetyltransferase [Catenisphaera adipataccumulans]|jgi:GNAT superfamily N-acetyltransferase|uniref:GNAT superfamily N-acetyltransferase n=1 Tax=Catenisphaera adipataccumulans TaxID=700500 RepID=A0A7W8CWU5_9FIRM|nr:GNAT family N-acetyltransferase [Catenisphaera adipataccumulans]MBB5183075.1 GNAT superfamily N-acetyltransferase [Catenisphaera adipataccumulans]
MEIHSFQPADRLAVRRLYEAAFPAAERLPFEDLVRWGQQEDYLFDCAYEKVFCGFYFVRLYKNILYLYYIATIPNARGQGLGGQMLDQLQMRYPGRQIIVEIEWPDTPMHIRRRQFYLRHGFHSTRMCIHGDSWKFELLCTNGPFDDKSYLKLVKSFNEPSFDPHLESF